jgi:hypothetical protein
MQGGMEKLIFNEVNTSPSHDQTQIYWNKASPAHLASWQADKSITCGAQRHCPTAAAAAAAPVHWLAVPPIVWNTYITDISTTRR